MYSLEKQLPLLAQLNASINQQTLSLIERLSSPEYQNELSDFLHAATEHGIQEVVHQNIYTIYRQLCIPIPVLLEKQRLLSYYMHSKQNQERQWVRCFESKLAIAGIKAVRLKGKSYIHHVYINSFLRYSGDTDFLLKKQDLKCAEIVLRTLAAETGLQVHSSLDDSWQSGYVREENSHYACYNLYSPTVTNAYTIEFHMDVEFLSPMQLHPIYDGAVLLDDGSWITSPIDTLLVACNHAWNHFPYSFVDFYYHPMILRHYMDIRETYLAVKTMGYTDEDILRRAHECNAQDVMGNTFIWTNLVYQTPYDHGDIPPDYLLPIFTLDKDHYFPCDICTKKYTSRFVDRLFGREKERERVLAQFCSGKLQEISLPLNATISNQISCSDISDRYLTRTFCLWAPVLSAELNLSQGENTLDFSLLITGPFFCAKTPYSDRLDGNVSSVTLAFIGEQLRAFHFQQNASGLFCIIQQENSGSLSLCNIVQFDMVDISTNNAIIRGKIPHVLLPSDGKVHFDFQLHWRGLTRDQLQDMSWGGSFFTGPFYSMLEENSYVLPFLRYSETVDANLDTVILSRIQH